MKSLQGHLLIASPELTDPNFCRSVVLIVQHGKNGALGLILNRPLDTPIRKAWEEVSELPCQAEGNLNQGGPCEGLLTIVHTDERFSDVEVVPGVYFSAEKEVVEELITDSEAEMRVFVGYAGWSPGQLEAEMKQGGWLVASASSEFIFDGSEGLWHALRKQIARTAPLPGVNPKTIPVDPSMN